MAKDTSALADPSTSAPAQKWAGRTFVVTHEGVSGGLYRADQFTIGKPKPNKPAFTDEEVDRLLSFGAITEIIPVSDADLEAARRIVASAEAVKAASEGLPPAATSATAPDSAGTPATKVKVAEGSYTPPGT